MVDKVSMHEVKPTIVAGASEWRYSYGGRGCVTLNVTMDIDVSPDSTRARATATNIHVTKL